MNQVQQENDATTQAALWQAKLSSDLVTKQQQRKFKQWLAQSSENRQAWQEVSLFWHGLDALKIEDIISPENLLTINSAHAEQSIKNDLQTRPTQINKAPFSTRYKRTKPLLAMAASLLLIVSLFSTQFPLWFADFHTAPGELRKIELSDGSTVILNTDTSLSLNFTNNFRTITLHQGEAYFDVAADSARPFIVKTNNGRIRALGTEFDIKNRSANTEVTVFEHSVRVTLNNGKVIEQLPEGQQLTFNEQRITPATPANLSRIQSWRDHHIIFQNKPLAEVIRELSHYRSGTIIILDKEIKSLAVTGIFDTNDTNIALKTIAQSLAVKITKITEKLVLVSAR